MEKRFSDFRIKTDPVRGWKTRDKIKLQLPINNRELKFLITYYKKAFDNLRLTIYLWVEVDILIRNF
jgi:hypothetical protein